MRLPLRYVSKKPPHQNNNDCIIFNLIDRDNENLQRARRTIRDIVIIDVDDNVCHSQRWNDIFELIVWVYWNSVYSICINAEYFERCPIWKYFNWINLGASRLVKLMVQHIVCDTQVDRLKFIFSVQHTNNTVIEHQYHVSGMAKMENLIRGKHILHDLRRLDYYYTFLLRGH